MKRNSIMKIDLKKIFPSFPKAFVLAFIGTCGNSTKHPKFGTHQLTPNQLKYASGEYKSALYKNIIECLEVEVDYIQEGLEGDMSEPLVGGAYIKMLYKHAVDGSHELNKRLKYPELMEIVDKLAKETALSLETRIPEETNKVESAMTYKQGFVMEELIDRFKSWEDNI